MRPEPRPASPTQPGLRFASASPLLAAALALLQEGPQSAESIGRQVLGLVHAPPSLARRLVGELLAADPRLSVDGRGVWRLEEPPPPTRVPLPSLRYAVVDVETTGGRPDRGGRIVEIAVLEVRDGIVRDRFASLVDPGMPMPPWVSRLTGITDGMLAEAPPFSEISDEVRRRLEGRVFVAHNASFDWRFVAAEMHRARSLMPSGPRLCTVRLARRALPGLARRGLDAVAGYYAIPIRDRHRALGDAAATATILPRLLAEAERAGVSRWAELQRWLDGGGPPPRGEPGQPELALPEGPPC